MKSLYVLWGRPRKYGLIDWMQLTEQMGRNEKGEICLEKLQNAADKKVL
jgi:hypothetical protein